MPQIVKFIDPCRPRNSSNIRKTTATHSTASTAASTETISAHEARRELFKSVNERIEQLKVTELKGKERRRYLLDRMTSLGLPPQQTGRATETSRPRVPMRIAMEMMKKAKERAHNLKSEQRAMGNEAVLMATDEKSMQRSRMMSTISGAGSGGEVGGHQGDGARRRRIDYLWTSPSHPMRVAFDKKSKVEQMNGLMRGYGMGTGNKRIINGGGIDVATGKYRDGMLKLSQKEISQISSSDRSAGRSTGRGRGGGRGGSMRGSRRGRR